MSARRPNLLVDVCIEGEGPGLRVVAINAIGVFQDCVGIV